MPTYNHLTFDTVCDRLGEAKNTLICFHSHPDGDAVGSAFALRRLIELAGGRAYCVCADEIPHRLAFLTPEQTSALPESIPADFQPERILSVDTASPNQLGRLLDLYGGKIEFMIDHHEVGEPYADHYIIPSAAACGEIIYDIAREMATSGALEHIPADVDARLYAAISSDTGCFRYSNVTPDTHRRAAELLRAGINAAQINTKLFACKSFAQLKAEKAGFDHLEFYENGRISAVIFPYALKQSLDVKDEHLETLVDVARCIEGVDVAVAIRQSTEANVYRVSTRAQIDFDVSAVCAVFGGGGHTKAAGCTIEGGTIEEARERVVAEIKKRL